MISRTYPRELSHLPTVAAADRARDPARATFLIGLTGVAALIAVTAPFMSRYGWDRDELYFLSAAHHLALGYVDFPPLIAVVGWLVDKLAPGSLVALRMVSLAAGAATVILAAFIARELGGGRRAQWMAALGWALTPYILGSASIFHPTWLDALAWTSFLYVTVRLLVRHEPRLWLLLGLIAGIGLEAKYTIGFLVLAFTAALILGGERRQLASVWPWLGLAIAIALLVPNLVWQVQHAWPSVHFFSSQNAQTASGTSRPAYIAQQLLFLGSTVVLACGRVSCGYGDAGCARWRSFRFSSRRSSSSSVGAAITPSRRTCCPSPRGQLPSTVGCEPGGGWRSSLSALALQVAVIALAGPIVIPFYSTRQLVSSSIWKIGYFKDEVGWPEMTAQVERSWNGPSRYRARRRCDPRPQLWRSLGAAALRTRAANDPQRTPQLAVLAPKPTPGPLRPHGGLPDTGPRDPVQVMEPCLLG